MDVELSRFVELFMPARIFINHAPKIIANGYNRYYYCHFLNVQMKSQISNLKCSPI
jgi:hypothetical protein